MLIAYALLSLAVAVVAFVRERGEDPRYSGAKVDFKS